MKPMATYNWQIAEQKRLRKERIASILIGAPLCIITVFAIASADSLVELFLKSIGL